MLIPPGFDIVETLILISISMYHRFFRKQDLWQNWSLWWQKWYDERRKLADGITNNELEVLRKVIRANSLEGICYTYTVQYKGKTLAVVQVEKSKSIIIAGGGAYIRNGAETTPLASKDVISRILSDSETSGTTSSEPVLERLEKRVEQLYDQLRHSQEVYEDELQRQKEEHRNEMLSTKKSNWFFCILGAVLGGIVGKIF